MTGLYADRPALRARVAFHFAGVSARGLTALQETFGSLEEAVRAPRSRLAATPGLNPLACASFATMEPDELVARGESELVQFGLRLVPRGEPDYPPQLEVGVRDAPSFLYVLGNFDARRQAVAIVGARASDGYAREVARGFARAFAQAGLVIASGAARGVDSAAHQGARDVGGATVAVVATGLGSGAAIGPTERTVLTSGGALLSEVPPWFEASDWNFTRRNRVISGLSHAVLAVGVGQGSGTMVTVRHALRQERKLYVVPGPIGNPIFEGSNDLLENGKARWARRSSAVLADLGVSLPSPEADVPLPALAPEAAQVLAALGPMPRQIDEISRALGLAAGALSRRLLELELKGLCAERPGKYYVRVAPSGLAAAAPH